MLILQDSIDAQLTARAFRMNPFDPEAISEKLQASQVSSLPPDAEALGAANHCCAAASLTLWRGVQESFSGSWLNTSAASLQNGEEALAVEEQGKSFSSTYARTILRASGGSGSKDPSLPKRAERLKWARKPFIWVRSPTGRCCACFACRLACSLLTTTSVAHGCIVCERWAPPPGRWCSSRLQHDPADICSLWQTGGTVPYKQQPEGQVLQLTYMWRGPGAACGFTAWTSFLQQLPRREAPQHQSSAGLAESWRIIVPAMLWSTAQEQQPGAHVVEQICMPGIAC